MNFNAAHALDNGKISDRKHKSCATNTQAGIFAARCPRTMAARYRSHLSQCEVALFF
jgi:hypothetical protein